MSISRRIFLRTGTMVVLGAAAQSGLAKVTLGRKSSGRDNSTPGFRVPGGISDPLSSYTKATFLAHLNEKFRLRMGNSSWQVTLVKVVDYNPPQGTEVNGNGECFSLVFRGSKQLPQATYTVEHGTLGTFKLLLVPSSKADSVPEWDAVINRLNS